MSKELTTTKSFFPAPTSFEEAWRIAQVLADSDMVPKDYKGKPSNCLIAMQWGADLGIPGMQALQNIAVINGRPSIWGDVAKALALVHPDCEDIQELFEGEGDNLTAVCISKRRGKSAVTSRFSVADAKAAGLWGKQGPWSQYKNRMLQMRARGFSLRDAFPDALRGLSIAEESQDIVVEKDIQTGEQYTAAYKPAEKAIEYYSDEEFNEKSAKWHAMIESGKKTADDLVSMVQSKGKLFTEDQLLTFKFWQDLYNENNQA
jgi:hypothetical protein